MSLFRLSDQLAVWNEWHESLEKRGALEEWERRLSSWNGREPLDGALWARLLKCQRAKDS
jgi:hypothetical protein